MYNFYKKNRFKIFLALVILNVVLFLGVFLKNKVKIFPELKGLSKTDLTFSELNSHFKDIAMRKGPLYAFDLLKVAQLPPDIDIHLLAHTIGNILYKEKGLDGIKFCTNDFRNACSHTIVIGLFVERGIDVIEDIARTCREAPGGSGAYGMCFHGLGHGVLAYSGYELRTALDLCRRVGSPEFGYVESAECVGGVIMEMIEGVHDRQAWEAKRETYFKAGDPLYPCNQGFVPSNGRNPCFSYLTPRLLEAAGADLGSPTEKDFEIAFTYCSKLTEEQSEYREACFGGFGKEFVTLAQNRDIRKVGSINNEDATQVYRWCLLAKDKDAVGACIRDALNSIYWGGENGTAGVILFCNSINDSYFKSLCFDHSAGIFNYYNKGMGLKLRRICLSVPKEYRFKCISR